MEMGSHCTAVPGPRTSGARLQRHPAPPLVLLPPALHRARLTPTQQQAAAWWALPGACAAGEAAGSGTSWPDVPPRRRPVLKVPRALAPARGGDLQGHQGELPSPVAAQAQQQQRLQPEQQRHERTPVPQGPLPCAGRRPVQAGAVGWEGEDVEGVRVQGGAPGGGAATVASTIAISLGEGVVVEWVNHVSGSGLDPEAAAPVQRPSSGRWPAGDQQQQQQQAGRASGAPPAAASAAVSEQEAEAAAAAAALLRAAPTWREVRRLLAELAQQDGGGGGGARAVGANGSGTGVGSGGAAGAGHGRVLLPEHLAAAAARLRRVAQPEGMSSRRERLAFKGFVSGYLELAG